MSTLKTTNLQESNASGANIVLGTGSGGGATISGVTTATTLRATTGIITAFSGDITIDDKIVHAGDTNTSIRFPSADTITTETNGSERIRITSAGQVNIGAAAPTASENGQLNVYITTSSGKAQIVHSAGTGGLRLAGTGNGSGSNLVFSNNYNSGTYSDHWTLTHNGGDDSFRFLAGGTGGTEAFRINSNGTHSINSPIVFAWSPGTTRALTDATWTKNTWLTSEDIDTDGAFADSKFTVPANKAGKYYVSVGANLYGNDNNIRNARCVIYKNGSIYARAHAIVMSTSSSTLRHLQCVTSCILDLAVGDYIENYMYLDVDSGALYMSSDNDTVRANFLMVYKIG